MSNKVFINDLGFIEQVYDEVQDFSSVQGSMDEARQLLSDNKSKLVLVDVSKIRTTNSGAREAAVVFLRESKFTKLAVFGGNIFIKNLANLVIRASGQNQKSQVFKTRDEAVSWLNIK